MVGVKPMAILNLSFFLKFPKNTPIPRNFPLVFLMIDFFVMGFRILKSLNRHKNTGLKPIVRHIEKSCIALHYGHFFKDIK